MLSCEFCEISTNTLFQNTSGRLLLILFVACFYIFHYQKFSPRKKVALCEKSRLVENRLYLGWGWSKNWFFVQKSWFFYNSKQFRLNIDAMLFMPFLHFLYFQFLSNHNGHDQYLIMFKGFPTFSNLPIFHSKQSIIILKFILLIAIIYSLGENKKTKLLKQFFD